MCGSMTLLRRKLDHLSEDVLEVQNDDPSHPGEADASEEEQDPKNTTVTQEHFKSTPLRAITALCLSSLVSL